MKDLNDAHNTHHASIGKPTFEHRNTAFRHHTVEPLHQFLEISPLPPAYHRRNNATKPTDLPDELAEYFVNGLMQQYDYVPARFGDAVPDSWLF